MQDIVCNIYYIINRTQADYLQTVLQPFGAFLHGHTLNRYARIAQAGFRILDNDFDSRSRIVDLESIHIRTFQGGWFAVLLQIGSQVAGNTEMRSGIHTVRCDVYFQHIVALYIIIFLSRSSYYRIGRQHDDTGVIRSDTDFILGTDHPVRFDTANLGTLYRKTLVAIIQFSTVHSHNHFLSGCHIRSAANNLQGFCAAYIHGRDVQVVGIRVFFTGKNFTDHKSFQSTFNGLNFFYSTGFQTDRGKCCCYFIRL